MKNTGTGGTKITIPKHENASINSTKLFLSILCEFFSKSSLRIDKAINYAFAISIRKFLLIVFLYRYLFRHTNKTEQLPVGSLCSNTGTYLDIQTKKSNFP